MQQRTRAYALDVIKLVESLPRTRTADVIGRQLLRSATSVGANYRAACRARSAADFIAKMGIAEGNEIVAIIVASIRTARGTKR